MMYVVKAVTALTRMLAGMHEKEVSEFCDAVQHPF